MEWLVILFVVVIYLVYRASKSREHASGEVLPGSQERGQAIIERRIGYDSRRPSSTAQQSPAAARWLAPREAVTVAGFAIESGMIYLGGVLPGQRPRQCGNCVIDPTCVVAGSGADQQAQTMPYWPSYQDILPVARRTYLKWLSEGRRDPSIGIGYVFLFFYGLERRVLLDRSKDETGPIVAEVHRLLGLYGENSSFRNYATKFLDAATFVAGGAPGTLELSPGLGNGQEAPLGLRLVLGSKLARKEPLEARDALAWVISQPDTYLRTPAKRCFQELVELWEHRFTALHPAGLKVNAPKTRLSFEYRAASGGFACRLEAGGGTLAVPDINAVKAPLQGLRALLEKCTEDLSPYSRLIGRKPDSRGTMEAASVLPRELLSSATGAGAAAAGSLEPLFHGRSVADIRTSELAEALSIDLGAAGAVSAAMCNRIGDFLERLDIGLEPDRRHGSRGLRAEGRVILFKAPNGARVDGEGAAYAAARTMVEVAAMAAGSDGRPEPRELDAINADMAGLPGLGDLERARLRAYASVLFHDATDQLASVRKLRSLAGTEKETVARSAATAIMADGHASPAEVRFLERLCRTLDLPPGHAYALLHRGAAASDDPVAIASENMSRGTPIPSRPAPASGASGNIAIDEAKLARLRAETSAVSEMLAGIFGDDDVSVSPAAVERGNAAPSRFSGLDGPHASLLGTLLDEGSLGRQAFEEKARALRLLPDGAIELLNDWGFDRFDEPVIEDGDEVAVLDHMKTQLTQVEAAA